VYLGSFDFRADGLAAGTFRIGFRKPETLLWGASPAAVPPETSPGIEITVRRQAP
jgi:hypothetical protein